MTVWKPVVGHEENYLISDEGQVWSRPRRRTTGGLLTPTVGTTGYLEVYLPGRKHAKIHHLVAETFIGPRPAGMVVRHVNGNGLDNRPENLRWGSGTENTIDAIEHGTHYNSSKTHCAQGHEFTEENTHPRPRGGRRCRACEWK